MAGFTFIDFFGLSIKGFWDEIFSGENAAAALSQLRRNLAAQVPPAQWPAILATLPGQAKALFDFDLDLVSVLVNGWRKHRELSKYADAKKFPADESHVVPLAKHTMKVEHHPYIELLLGTRSLGKLPFDVILTLDLDGFIVTIQNGKITKLQTGTCEGKGKIEIMDHTLVEKALTKIVLPMSVDLGDGISLRRSADAEI